LLTLGQHRPLGATVAKIARSLAKEATSSAISEGQNANYSVPRAAKVAANGVGLRRLWEQQWEVLESEAAKSECSRKCAWMREIEPQDGRKMLLKVSLQEESMPERVKTNPLLKDLIR